MSYDVFFRGFKGGDAAAGGGGAVRALLEPHVTQSESEQSFVRIEVEDGGADIYLNDDHMMVNHASGTAPWDVLVRAAAAANWTILLPDGPPALTDERQRHELPARTRGGSSRGHKRSRTTPDHREPLNMTFDPLKVPGGDVAKFGAECRAKALDGVSASDWRPVYDWTKSWIGWGGGAWLPDTWILYAVSALLQGKPRIGVHALDLGIKTWIDGDRDRSVLTFCRGAIVLEVLADPRCAQPDLEAAAAIVPEWLVAGATERLAACRERAPKSRKRVPSVKPRPDHAPPEWRAETVAPAVVARADGDEPEVWKDVRRFFLPN